MKMTLAVFVLIVLGIVATTTAIGITSCASKSRDAGLETRIERLEAIVSVDVELEWLRSRIAELKEEGP